MRASIGQRLAGRLCAHPRARSRGRECRLLVLERSRVGNEIVSHRVPAIVARGHNKANPRLERLPIPCALMLEEPGMYPTCPEIVGECFIHLTSLVRSQITCNRPA